MTLQQIGPSAVDPGRGGALLRCCGRSLLVGVLACGCGDKSPTAATLGADEEASGAPNAPMAGAAAPEGDHPPTLAPADEPEPGGATPAVEDGPDEASAADAAVPPATVTRLGLDLTRAEVVHDAEELLAAIGSRRTVLVAPGSYLVPEGGLIVAEGTTDLALVGLGADAPQITSAVRTGPLLRIDGASRITVHHLVFHGSDGDPPHTGPAARVSDSKDIRFDDVFVERASHCLAVTNTAGFLLEDGALRRCSGTMASFVDSESPRLKRSKFTVNRVAKGIVVQHSTLAVERGRFLNNTGTSQPDGSVLFVIAGQGGHARRPKPPSKIELTGSVLTDNAFDRLTSSPSRLEVDAATTIGEDQFADASRNDETRWACNCEWQQTEGGYQPRTRCHDALESCEAATTEIRDGTRPGVLPAGLIRGCTITDARDLPTELGEASEWTRDPASGPYTFEGKCMPGGRGTRLTAHAPPAPRPDGAPAPARSWSTLAPPLSAGTTASRVWVQLRTDDAALEARVAEYGAQFKYRRGSKKIPPAIAEMEPPYFVSLAGVSQPDPKFNSAELFGTLIDGAWWKVNYHRGAARGLAVGFVAEPHPDAKLRRAPARRPRKLRSAAVRALTKIMRGDDPEWALAEHATCHGQAAPGRFPGGAVKVWVVTCDGLADVDDDEGGHTALFTQDAAGTTVQVFWAESTDWSTLTALGDLDGDGFDEIIVREQEIEHASDVLIRTTKTDLSLTTMFASGH